MTDRAVGTRATNLEVIGRLRATMYDWDGQEVLARLGQAFAPDAEIHLAHPFEDLDGPTGLFEAAYVPLQEASPDLERRDLIVMAGTTAEDNDWVGCCTYYTGTFAGPFLGIPPTGRQFSMRAHEFFRLVDGRVVEMQALWDVPELMMQSGCWPMGPTLGREWHVPGPSTQDGLQLDRDQGSTDESLRIVRDMLTDMGRHPTEPVEAMRLERYWHPRMSWYGPSGIGTARGIDGFRRHHQIPFLKAMPDRQGSSGSGHAFADGDFVGFTGWPGMAMTVTGDGWLGIAPSDTAITMRSLDFWRVEDGLIRENWVLVDLLHAWSQLGVDVLARVVELTSR
ncbi:MAG: ester cyclase [Actinomycetota bacterium]